MQNFSTISRSENPATGDGSVLTFGGSSGVSPRVEIKLYACGDLSLISVVCRIQSYGVPTCIIRDLRGIGIVSEENWSHAK